MVLLTTGSLSLLGTVTRDYYTFTYVLAVIHCICGVVTRFLFVTDFLVDNKILAVCICLVFHFGNGYICICTVFLCGFRILCLQNITFVEDHFDEKWVRISAAMIGSVNSLISCILIALNGDVMTGTVFSMLTKQAIPDGMNCSYNFSWQIYFTLFVSFAIRRSIICYAYSLLAVWYQNLLFGDLSLVLEDYYHKFV